MREPIRPSTTSHSIIVSKVDLREALASTANSMTDDDLENTTWSLEPAIDVLRSATLKDPDTQSMQPNTSRRSSRDDSPGGLGDFSEVWKFLGVVSNTTSDGQGFGETLSPSAEFAQLVKGVKWRDEHDGADLEDNAEPQEVSASQLRTRKRAARRARARDREMKLPDAEVEHLSETASNNASDNELEALRHSPDRRAVIAEMLGRPRPVEVSPPTSPSPPKTNSTLRTPAKKEWPISNPFLWTAPTDNSVLGKVSIDAVDGLTPRLRKMNLVTSLMRHFPEEQKYLKNPGLLEPAFTPLNTSPIGVHVFIDMSNISIGFHDCLKVARGIPISTRVRRIPMNFHNLSLVLERGRPAAKRVVCGSDRTATIHAAEACGYEANILDRVHKAKMPTPSARRHRSKIAGGGYNSASNISHGETSGSETPGYLSNPGATYKWSEQAVDEILHLKMSHSILDAEKPSTMVLATGDAAEAEYSDGFLKMVERALKKGWTVELVSFKLNTSSLYRKKEWRAKYGPMFKWIQLDDFVEALIDESS